MTKTTIQVEKATRDKLWKLGGRGESYDDIINRLILKVKEKERNEE